MPKAIKGKKHVKRASGPLPSDAPAAAVAQTVGWETLLERTGGDDSRKGVTCNGSGEVIKLDLSMTGAKGDIGKVRLPASLQSLYLLSCRNITGNIAAAKWPEGLQDLRFYQNKVSGDLSKARFPQGLQKLQIGSCVTITGDLARVKWPSGIKEIHLARTGVSGDLSKIQFPSSLHTLCLKNFSVRGDLANFELPASLQKLDLSGCRRITASPGCPKGGGDFYYGSKEACDDLRQWIASQ